MHIARKVLKFNRNIEVDIEKEYVQAQVLLYLYMQTMSDAYNEHIAILKGLLFVAIVAKTVKCGF